MSCGDGYLWAVDVLSDLATFFEKNDWPDISRKLRDTARIVELDLKTESDIRPLTRFDQIPNQATSIREFRKAR